MTIAAGTPVPAGVRNDPSRLPTVTLDESKHIPISGTN